IRRPYSNNASPTEQNMSRRAARISVATGGFWDQGLRYWCSDRSVDDVLSGLINPQNTSGPDKKQTAPSDCRRLFKINPLEPYGCCGVLVFALRADLLTMFINSVLLLVFLRRSMSSVMALSLSNAARVRRRWKVAVRSSRFINRSSRRVPLLLMS